MEKTPYRESDSKDKKFAPEDEASYYLGDNFELGGVEYGWREEENRNRSRFGEKVWNEKDYIGSDIERSDDEIYQDAINCIENSDIDSSGVDVDVRKGTIYLNGKVADRSAKRGLEKSVEFIEGVKDVMNSLQF